MNAQRIERIVRHRAVPTVLSTLTLIAMIALRQCDMRAVALLIGMIGGLVLAHVNEFAWRKLWSGVVVATLMFQPLLTQAQEAPGPEPAPGWSWDYMVALKTSMPDQNLPQDKLGPWAVGLCVAGIAVVGAIIINKVISACMNEYEWYVTNNAACGACPAQAPLPSSPEPVPSPSSPVPGTDDCKCAAPPAPGQPLPLRIEHSFDKDVWTSVAEGISIGSEFVLPDTGYWRLVPLFLTISPMDGVLTVHAPPGALEFSADLREWVPVGVFHSPTDLPAQAGFYRTRLN